MLRNLRFCLLLVALGQSVAGAEELSYFDSKIDFWGEKPNSTPLLTISKTKKTEFPWKTYLDPKNKEFFKEGDYTPPEPFMEIARNPSDDNIKQWFEFMRKKNELAEKLQKRMAEYIAKNSTAPSEIKVTLDSTGRKSPKSNSTRNLDVSRFRVRMYFDSKCPHCKRMFAVLKRMQDRGIQVEALQVDRGEVDASNKIISIGLADPSDVERHKIKGVPFVIVADLKRKALLPPIEGFHEYDEMIELLKAASST